MATTWSNIVARAKGKRPKKNSETDEGSHPATRSSPRWGGRARGKADDEAQDSLGDPHDLVSRFIWTQQQYFDEALAELKRGRKCSCWMWYIFPTPPWIVNGQERGSGTNMRYALRTDEQAKAYLNLVHAGVNLRQNYLEASEAIVFHLEKGSTARQIVGIADEPKLISSWEYFEKMTRDEPDQALHNLIVKGLSLIKEGPGKNATKAKTKKQYKFSASSEDDEPESSVSPAATNTNMSDTKDAMSEISSASESLYRNASESSTSETATEMVCEPASLEQNKVGETVSGNSTEASTADMFCEPSPVDNPEKAASTSSGQRSLDEDPATTLSTETGIALGSPKPVLIYCEVVDCFECVPCSEHRADDTEV